MPLLPQPIIVGVGQLVHRPGGLEEVREPLDLMAECARRAAEDAGIPGRLAAVDSLTVINVITRPYADPAGFLAARLGIDPPDRVYTSVGGNSPQWRVNESAERIARGEIRLALLAGAEAMHGLRIARRAGVKLDWGPRGSPELAGDDRWGTSEVEARHGARVPIAVYPLFENALRHRRGWSIARHRDHLAQLCARFAEVARDNPYAWFRDGKTAAEIAAVGPDNRMIAFPYPKFMNAIMTVDQAAALLLTDTATARDLGIPEEKWIYVRGCGDATEHWFVGERADFCSAPALRIAAARALAQARLTIDEIDYLDLYSCFPSAVQIAAEMLGIVPDDPRPLTVTGGLAYHGGPGNNYAMHSIATMVERLRGKPGATGLTNGIGWYLSKHGVGIYSTDPPAHPFQREDPRGYQPLVDALPRVEVADGASGPATVETYTVLHDHDGAPSLGILACRLPDGRRTWANMTDPAVLERIEVEEIIGRQGQVRHDPSTQINAFEL